MPEVTDPYVNKNLKYGAGGASGELVPKLEYKCTSTTVLTKGTTMTHPCRTLKGHEGDHKCICNHTWPQTAAENKEKN